MQFLQSGECDTYILTCVLTVGTSAVAEKRAGILKPQGSLEKAREKEAAEVVWNHNQNHGGPSVTKRGRQNVAMQAIMRKSVFLGELESSRNLEAKQVIV